MWLSMVLTALIEKPSCHPNIRISFCIAITNHYVFVDYYIYHRRPFRSMFVVKRLTINPTKLWRDYWKVACYPSGKVALSWNNAISWWVITTKEKHKWGKNSDRWWHFWIVLIGKHKNLAATKQSNSVKNGKENSTNCDQSASQTFGWSDSQNHGAFAWRIRVGIRFEAVRDTLRRGATIRNFSGVLRRTIRVCMVPRQIKIPSRHKKRNTSSRRSLQGT